jgi:chromosome segregation ATPase
MALLRSKTAAPKPFVVPTMNELSTDYAQRVERFNALNSAIGTLRQEAAALSQELADMPAPAMRASVAALLGDEVVDRRAEVLARLTELRRSITDHETAIELQRTRISEARVQASRLVREGVKGEYGRRVAELLTRLQAAVEARNDLDDLVNDLERDDVSWLPLGVFRAKFLGDRDGGPIARMYREAKDLGYVA